VIRSHLLTPHAHGGKGSAHTQDYYSLGGFGEKTGEKWVTKTWDSFLRLEKMNLMACQISKSPNDFTKLFLFLK